ncbi:protein DpdH [uncultured Jatrophihabitans sp.]|uniref:protein DpdH n=1 Tax=uncultured Jatrophihabitans sp. TaxID=1610747 RepID=UPI0035CACCEE
MTAQVNVVCWSTEEVTSTIPTEAATPSRAVLLATHSPLRITRQRGEVGGRATTDSVSEQEVLEEFLSAPPSEGYLAATVLGESGAGKSHLIRWIEANIEEHPHRHVIYLQKTETSLKDVIEKLLLDQTEPEFEEIRRKLSSLGSGMTPDEMEQRILDGLAEALRTRSGDNPFAKKLVGENGLRLIFLDPLLRSHLLRPNSFVKRYAHYALNGRAESEPDMPLEFTLEDLPTDIGSYSSINDAALATRTVVRDLISKPTMQVEAVRLLNHVLEAATIKAASLNAGDVSQAFKRIREKFVGHEIVLLIEDVALIQGVRRDLLDAIVEVGIVQGQEKYATVRTMLAVTSGYYRELLPDTFRTRAEASSPVYTVEVEFDTPGADEQVFADFMGRYLNAARVGKARLEQASPEVSNACLNCEYQSSCHEAFGASQQGYGLYPYNKAALMRAVRACADKGSDRAVFNPRRVLSRAVRDMLNDNVQTLKAGKFPPPGFLGQESSAMGLPFLPVHVQEEIQKAFSGDDGGRADTLLTFWGDVGREAISDEILAAFSHPPLPSDLTRAHPTDRTPDPVTAAPGDLPPSVRSQLDGIDIWLNGKDLRQGLAADMRTMIRDRLLARIDWFDPAIKEPDTATLAKAVPDKVRISHTVSIEGASENLPPSIAPIIRLPRDARTAMMFRGLILIKAGFWQRAGDALPRLDATVAGRVDEAKRRIQRAMAVDDASLAHVAASLIRGAGASGGLPSKPKELDFANAIFWLPPADLRSDEASRAPQWLAAYREYTVERSAVIDHFARGIGVAQGTGAVHAVDYQRLSGIVRMARKLLTDGTELDVPDWGTKAHRRLAFLEQACQAQLAYWQDLIDRIRVDVPQGTTVNETTAAILDAVKAGHSYGFVKVSSLADLQVRNEAAAQWDQSVISSVERLLDTAETESGLALLSVVGAPAGADLQAVADYLAYSRQWIEAGVADAESDSGTVSDLDNQIGDVVQNWFRIVEEGAAND